MLRGLGGPPPLMPDFAGAESSGYRQPAGWLKDQAARSVRRSMGKPSASRDAR